MKKTHFFRKNQKLKKKHFTKKFTVRKVYEKSIHSLRHLKEGSKSFPKHFSKSTSHNSKALFSLFPLLLILGLLCLLDSLVTINFFDTFFLKIHCAKTKQDIELWSVAFERGEQILSESFFKIYFAQF